jgi:hypothetical protein
VLGVSSLDLEEIATALADQTVYEHRWLINPETGDIVFWASETRVDACLMQPNRSTAASLPLLSA